DSNPGPLTFQFNVSPPGGALSTVIDFNVGKFSGGVWSSQTFPWATIAGEGVYQIQIVATDFITGETATRTASFTISSRLAGGKASVHRSANPLVALFSAPSCPGGSAMRVTFQQSGSTLVNATNWKACHPPTTMNFYVAGMYP